MALDALDKLDREVRANAQLDREQARFLIDLYYRWQEHRIALSNQATALTKSEKPTEVVDHFGTQIAALERQMTTLLDGWTKTSTVGLWSRSVKGVGPVIAAGLMAHIDIHQAPTVGHIWRFAGLDPTSVWSKGEKRPWNARLKVVCWKLGDSFVKVSGREDAFYGAIYRERKALEVERNEAGQFAEQAAATLAAKKITEKATRACYDRGQLPPGRLDLRARRYAVKLFLSHWHHVAFVEEFGVEPPRPYILTTEGGHNRFIAPPNFDR